MTEETQHPSADSDRSRLKEGALATTALGVGAGAVTSTATAQNEEEAVVPGRYYLPDVDFDVIAQFETPVKDGILESFDDEFDIPDDWEAYAIEIDVGGSAGILGYMLVDEDELDVEEGDSGTFGESASFRSSELNLIEFDPNL